MSGCEAIKKPVRDRLSREPGNNPSSALQGADVLTKTALVTGSLVFVDQAFSDRFIDNRNGLAVSGLGGFRITGGNRFHDILDMGAQRGALTGIALAAVFSLTGAFTSLSRVRQNSSPVPGSKEPGTMRIFADIVNVARAFFAAWHVRCTGFPARRRPVDRGSMDGAPNRRNCGDRAVAGNAAFLAAAWRR